MTIRQLDELISKTLPATAMEIWRATKGECSQYDVQAALNIWTRNGWAERSTIKPAVYVAVVDIKEIS